jgi:hypothetical protein
MLPQERKHGGAEYQSVLRHMTRTLLMMQLLNEQTDREIKRVNRLDKLKYFLGGSWSALRVILEEWLPQSNRDNDRVPHSRDGLPGKAHGLRAPPN